MNEDLSNARRLVHENPRLSDFAFAKLASKNEAIEPTVVSAIESLRFDQWIYLRHTKTFAIFLDKKVENAYAVRALTTPLNELLGEPPFMFKAGFLKFEGYFICDGLILEPVVLGPGYRAQLKSAYTAIRKASRFHATAESSPGELPPQALAEPYVKLSPHTAPSVQSPEQSGDLLAPKAPPPKSWPGQG